MGDLMKTISLCMIVKDEEESLDKCLKSVSSIVEEIIIVITSDNQKTYEIANKYTKNIYYFQWINDFSKARNFAISKASKDYYLWLDADDYINEEEKDKIVVLKDDNEDIDIYYFLYDFDDNYMPFYRERLIKNNNKYLFKGRIHEAIIPSGNTKNVHITITQQRIEKGLTDRNIKIFESFKEDEFTTRDYYYYARELYRHGKYEKAKDYFNRHINCNDSFYLDKIDSLYFLSILSNNINESNSYLIDTFKLSLPKPNILCTLANNYLKQNKIEEAIYYYKLALNCKNNGNDGFIFKDYYDYIPSIQLCVCYDLLKDYKTAYYYNELANSYKSIPFRYKNNKEYLIKKIN